MGIRLLWLFLVAEVHGSDEGKCNAHDSHLDSKCNPKSPQSPRPKTALVLGGSGETGFEVLKHLVLSPAYAKIISLGRRQLELPTDHPGWEKVQQEIVNFDALEESRDKFKNIDVAFCCLGTTRAAAGPDGFVKVDHDYVVNSARLLREHGCPSMHLMSSQGANINSWFLYPQTKGQVEAELQQMGFPQLAVYRPGLLMCERRDTSRGVENVLRWVAGWVDRWDYVSVKTSTVARAMVETSLSMGEDADAFRKLEHSDITKFSPEKEK